MTAALADNSNLRAEAKKLIRQLAGMHAHSGETVEQAMRRVRQKLNTWTRSRVRDVWKGRADISVRVEEVDQLRACIVGELSGGKELAELQRQMRLIQTRLDEITSNMAREKSTARWLVSSQMVSGQEPDTGTVD